MDKEQFESYLFSAYLTGQSDNANKENGGDGRPFKDWYAENIQPQIENLVEASPPNDSTAVIEAYVAGYKYRAEASKLMFDEIADAWAREAAKEYLKSRGEV